MLPSTRADYRSIQQYLLSCANHQSCISILFGISDLYDTKKSGAYFILNLDKVGHLGSASDKYKNVSSVVCIWNSLVHPNHYLSVHNSSTHLDPLSGNFHLSHLFWYPIYLLLNLIRLHSVRVWKDLHYILLYFSCFILSCSMSVALTFIQLLLCWGFLFPTSPSQMCPSFSYFFSNLVS